MKMAETQLNVLFFPFHDQETHKIKKYSFLIKVVAQCLKQTLYVLSNISYSIQI